VRVLVSGSHGLIGSELVARLRSSGHEPVRLVRGVQRDLARPAEARWDIEAGTIDPGALDGMDAVVNLAGVGIAAHRWSPDHKRRVRSSRIDGTRLLAEAVAAAEPKPSVLVNASAIGYYGDRGDEELTEESGPGPGFLADLCRQWEAATGGAEAAGVRVVHLRSGIVLSPNGGALAKQLPLFRLGLGGRLGSGRQWTSWISLDDEVGAILHALGGHHGEMRGPLNATAPHPVTNAEFTRVLARVLRRPAVARAPGAALSAVMGAEMAKEMLLAGQRVLPCKLDATGYRFHHSELEPALRDLLGR
jgi:uncharacterized protein (TIGR01777 family)